MKTGGKQSRQKPAPERASRLRAAFGEAMHKIALTLFVVLLCASAVPPVCPQARDESASARKTSGASAAPAVGPEMVWDAPDEAIERARGECARPAGRRRCFVSVMRRAGASAAAVAFSTRLKAGVGYLKSFDRQGPVDVAKVVYPFRARPNESTVLVNGSPDMIDVGDPAYLNRVDLRRHKLYRDAARKGRGVRMWADEPGEVVVQPGAEDRTEVEVTFPLKSCRACEAVAHAVVTYEFEHTGRFVGVRLADLTVP